MPGAHLKSKGAVVGPKSVGINSSYGRTGSGGGAGPSGYQYGYPAYGAVEPNVKLQVLFDALADGSLTDEVNGTTFAQIQALSSHYSAYNKTTGGLYTGISPGILLDRLLITSGGQRANYQQSTDANIAAIGTTSAVIEWWIKPETTQTGANGYHFSLSPTAQPEFTAQGILCHQNGSETSLNIWIRADDDTLVQGALTIPAYYGSTVPIHFRLVIDRVSETVELFTEQESRGSFSIAALTGKSIPTNYYKLNGQYNSGANELSAIWYEFRVSVGADVLSNNSGILGR